MYVYVQDHQGKPLMPTQRLGKVRRWLKSGRASVVRREPFTIRLVDVDGGYLQPLRAGIDQGTAHMGVSVLSEQHEVLSMEVALRTDVSKLLTERRTFRRSRRGRTTRYRAPRFRNRKHQDALPPSIRAKVDETRKVIALVASVLPITTWTIELGNFDPHQLAHPDVSGIGYQQGDQHGFYNVREYVLWRDQHTCQHCTGKRKDPILQVHHLDPQNNGGSDRPDNLVTLCKTCHHDHHNGDPISIRAQRALRDPTQFNVLKSYIQRALVHLQPSITFGYRTKAERIALGLPKSHRNDAFVIAGGGQQQRIAVFYRGAFVRKQNRKQFKGARSQIRNTIPSAFGFKRGDRVRLVDGRQGFIVGLRSSGYFDVQRLDGTVLHHSAKHSSLSRLEAASTFRIERSTEKGVAHSVPA